MAWVSGSAALFAFAVATKLVTLAVVLLGSAAMAALSAVACGAKFRSTRTINLRCRLRFSDTDEYVSMSKIKMEGSAD